MSVQVVFILFIAVALTGWAVAEFKNRVFTFTHSEEEAEESAIIEAEKRKNDFREMNLKDLLAHNSTKGYQAV